MNPSLSVEPLQDFGSPLPRDRVKYGMLVREGGDRAVGLPNGGVLCQMRFGSTSWTQEQYVAWEWEKVRLVLQLGRHFLLFFKKIYMVWPFPFPKNVVLKMSVSGKYFFLSIS